MEFIRNNIGTISVLAIVLVIVLYLVNHLRKEKKNSACSGTCACCSRNCQCNLDNSDTNVQQKKEKAKAP